MNEGSPTTEVQRASFDWEVAYADGGAKPTCWARNERGDKLSRDIRGLLGARRVYFKELIQSDLQSNNQISNTNK